MICGMESDPRDPVEAYTWLQRARLIAEENRTPLTPEHATLSTDLRARLSPEERVRSERRALALHGVAREYSQMDWDFDECKAVFH